MLEPIRKILTPRNIITLVIFIILVVVYYAWLGQFQKVKITVSGTEISLPFPALAQKLTRQPLPSQPTSLPTFSLEMLTKQKAELIEQRRQQRIAKVENFFKIYGSPLVGYGNIFVDESERCGGDYRVLVGIAGSESGLGRINVLKYNPFGYLDGVQYNSQEEALRILSCRVSQQHIAKCGQDLWCLVRRYAGPGDDAALFVSKVAYFYSQVQ